MISSCRMDAAPCRIAVPRQSAPVSPPPMITTCLPAAEIGGCSILPRAYRLLSDQLRRFAAGDPLSNVVTGDY